jgi:hypothetical protein
MVIGNKGLGCKGFGCHNLEDKALTLAGFAKEICVWPQKQVADGYFLSLKFIFLFFVIFREKFSSSFFREIFQQNASYKCHKASDLAAFVQGFS